MMFARGMWRDDVQVVTAGKKYDPGSPKFPKPDWDNPVLSPAPACSIQPQTTREIRSGVDRIIVQTGWKMITRPGTRLEVSSEQRIRVPGMDEDLLIVGDPQQWDGIQPHTEIDLEVIYG